MSCPAAVEAEEFNSRSIVTPDCQLSLARAVRWQDTPQADSFIRDQLADLEERRKALELAVVDLDHQIAVIGRTTVDERVIRKALAAFGDAFAGLEPYRQKAMIGLVIQQATVSEETLTLSIHGEPVVIGENQTSGNANDARPDSGAWLRGRMAKGAIVVRFQSLRRVGKVRFGARLVA